MCRLISVGFMDDVRRWLAAKWPAPWLAVWPAPWNDENAIRDVVFSQERLESHAESLAAAQPVSINPPKVVSLRKRLASNAEELFQAHRVISSFVSDGRSLSPAAEWLLNNSHIIEEQIREIRLKLPPAYYGQLPKLAEGPFAGYPRVFGLAWAYVAHTDSHFDLNLLRAYVSAYQRVQPLTIGELWALPLTLQIVLVENLRRAAKRIVLSWTQRAEADVIADAFTRDPNGADSLAHASLVDASGAIKSAFVSQLVHRFNDWDSHQSRDWLETELRREDVSIDDLIRDEHARMGATNTTVRNILRSMRLIPDAVWPDFVEGVSTVNDVLATHPTFASMDFPSRNAYRTVIEELARRSSETETAIAQRAVDMATKSRGRGGEEPAADDPGHYLFGPGLKTLKTAINFQYRLSDYPAALTQRSGLTGYIVSLAFLVASILALPALALVGQGIAAEKIAILALAGFIPTLTFAIALVNRAITNELPPKLIPGLLLRDGVPAAARTLVVVPTLITDASSIEALTHTLEVHHLATGDDNIFYAIASDWTDASSEVTQGDKQLLTCAHRAVAALNLRHPTAREDEPRFYVFHRKRQWNAAEHRWMGWERKRGKLHELNRLLRGKPTSYISDTELPPLVPSNIRFVITLDTDTRLPRDAARRLIGKMLHPLNQPIFDEATRRVIGGYGILQPRVTPSLPEDRHASTFQRLFTAPGGIDPYAGAISDVYQDLFDEGSFAGKGIYDIDAFEAATAGRFPDNSVLSHDLIEGIYARAGLASDVEVVEEFPSRYDVARSRDHRWTRGDWQLLPWLLTGRSGSQIVASEKCHPSNIHELSALARWKLLDNLRRSLAPIMAVVALVVGWTLPAGAAVIWTAYILLALALPSLLNVFAAVVSPDENTSLRNHLVAAWADFRLALSQAAVDISLLADRAYTMADAIVRALYRRYFSHHYLLEWTTAAQAKSQAVNSVGAYVTLMQGGLAVATIAGAVTLFAGTATVIAAPVVALWISAPAIAAWISRNSSTDPAPPLTASNRLAFRIIARRTWRFFETVVGDSNNHLPPDNLQEEPQPIVAHRTSPTNIGLYLLTVASAREFGWISTSEAADRFERTLRTMGRLERHRGHFLNWYDTQTLASLEPRYISSVDSGNLAGHLLALAALCRSWSLNDEETRARDGAGDALLLLETELASVTPNDPVTTSALSILRAMLNASSAAERPNSSESAADWSVIAMTAETLVQHLDHSTSNPRAAVWAKALADTARSLLRDDPAAFEQSRLKRRLLSIADAAEHTALVMDFSFLIEPSRELLSIGYVVNTGQLDESCYDLLASEARLASLVAIAKGDLPTRHWFRLGRAILPADGQSVLTSWSGSMFEYLMPELVTMTPRESLLGLSMRTAVRQHMRHGQRNGTPWGVSESAYNARDLEFTYQYSPFGVATLGLKRGLAENHVIAPYATALAALVAPNEAAGNFSSLQSIGAIGNHGFYEAIDFTPTRVATAGGQEIVKAYMAHHQGMTIVALANVVFDNIIARAFHTNPIIQTVDLLLQERPPRVTPMRMRRATLVNVRAGDDDLELEAARRVRLDTARPSDCHFFGNGRLSAVMAASGAGQIKWNGMAITRWQADPTFENMGSFIYLRDRQTGTVWSATAQPTSIEPNDYVTTFSEDRVQVTRRDGTLETVLDVIVSPIDDAICRRLSITNFGNKSRVLDVTSYEELVLGQVASDVMHPAFSKLFVETSHRASDQTLIAKRRRRSAAEPAVMAAAFVTSSDDHGPPVEFETDRARFIGRGRTLASPTSIISGRALSGTVGAVLDPVFALRQRVVVAPGVTVRLSFWTVVADHQEKLDSIIEKHRDRAAYGRCATLAWTHGLVELRHLGVTAEEALTFQRIAGCLTFSERALRAAETLLRRGSTGFGPIWQEGISGDLPIALAYIDEVADLSLIRQLLHAFEYWRSKGLEIDLVIINDRATSYQQDLQTALETLLQSVTSRHRLNRDNTKGAVYLLRGDLLQPLTRAALPALARAVFHAKRGSLAEQVERLDVAAPPPSAPRRRQAEIAFEAQPADTGDLEFFNGYGGFGRDGKEYVMVLDSGANTPAPWINVVSNPSFGFMVSAEGAGYTWCLNSKERQLTPWSNDPVSNRPGEIFYIRDDDSGHLWSPTASPIRDFVSPYRAAHGQGYSRFQHVVYGIEATLEQFVAPSDPVKISRLRLRNSSNKVRSLSVTGYVEWVLGSARITTAGNITTAFDESRHSIFARNSWHHFFPDRVAFFALAQPIAQWTADRSHFFGRRGSVDIPSSLTPGARLNSHAGPGLDACAALQTRVTLQPGQEIEIVALLGDGNDRADAERLVDLYLTRDADHMLQQSSAAWDEITDAITIKTPDRALDILVNRWLPYQTLASRIWGRAGLYQAGGAYGFRDQLQDVMSLTTSRPDIARDHLLVAAGRQFPEGDVQHWWMSPSGHGIRTRIADSCLWLPYAAAFYVTTTGDTDVLDETVAFIDGPLLQDHEHEIYFAPQTSSASASLYEHCALSIDRSLATGANGLALFGGGDWNDGMNRVGIEGKGESVWLSWFLIVAIRGMLPLAEARLDTERHKRWSQHIRHLAEHIDVNAWDGEWYRRGVFDDGSLLGSASVPECQIDSIAQSWAVFSQAAPSERLVRAMQSVKDRLLDRDAKLAPLFTPPFDMTERDPGYIKGYPPGIRENGGQYTHAAIWSLIAFTEMKDGSAIADLLAMLNPINRTRSRQDCQLYRLEPYVVAADIYTVGANRGRGGWSWYTGSAGWLYRAVVEHVLGVRKHGRTLIVRPAIPSHWAGFEIDYRFGGGRTTIRVINPNCVTSGIRTASISGVALNVKNGCEVQFVMPGDDENFEVIIEMGACLSAQPQNVEAGALHPRANVSVGTDAAEADTAKIGSIVSQVAERP